jgi:hypothetical protein
LIHLLYAPAGLRVHCELGLRRPFLVEVLDDPVHDLGLGACARGRDGPTDATAAEAKTMSAAATSRRMRTSSR